MPYVSRHFFGLLYYYRSVIDLWNRLWAGRSGPPLPPTGAYNIVKKSYLIITETRIPGVKAAGS